MARSRIILMVTSRARAETPDEVRNVLSRPGWDGLRDGAAVRQWDGEFCNARAEFRASSREPRKLEQVQLRGRRSGECVGSDWARSSARDANVLGRWRIRGSWHGHGEGLFAVPFN